MPTEQQSSFTEVLPYGLMLSRQIERCNEYSASDARLFTMAVRGLYRLLTEEKKRLVDKQFAQEIKNMNEIPKPVIDHDDDSPFTSWLRMREYSLKQIVERSDLFFDAIMHVLSEKGYLEKLLTKRYGGAQSDFAEGELKEGELKK
ncbi:MAG: hypothetical protein HMLIMOIP_001690 [Candidatus Nitrosomirales archaeon]|jgi:hypothetical protein